MKIEEVDFPSCYLDSDRSSLTAQRIYKRITYAILILLFITTFYNSASGMFNIYSNLPNKISAGLLLLTAIGSTLMFWLKPERNWYVGRAVSESVRTLTWRFIMKSEPFNNSDESLDINELSLRFQDIMNEAQKEHFIPKSNDIHQEIVTQKMKDIRRLNYLERKDIYSRERIQNQINWYQKKSVLNKRYADVYGALLVIFQLLAAVYLFFFYEYLKILNLAEIMIFLSTATITLLELNKHKDLYQSYSLTKSELLFIRARFGAIQNDEELNEFVSEAELAISREHTMWLARRGNSEYLDNKS
ncbi:DUF4231 domain-containing protein [Pedobacter sp. B4-66]|uniref:DUF4231 domain-containing protein n=1 Tax=Pedobacter sp. B4-66 TaxID=2817280 RepID=UPI001BDA0CCB|nr:DUF4231 domain-containing protein [Pedobacter sp. B4-66]